jgi:hypothetical protein
MSVKLSSDGESKKLHGSKDNAEQQLRKLSGADKNFRIERRGLEHFEREKHRELDILSTWETRIP